MEKNNISFARFIMSLPEKADVIVYPSEKDEFSLGNHWSLNWAVALNELSDYSIAHLEGYAVVDHVRYIDYADEYKAQYTFVITSSLTPMGKYLLETCANNSGIYQLFGTKFSFEEEVKKLKEALKNG